MKTVRSSVLNGIDHPHPMIRPALPENGPQPSAAQKRWMGLQYGMFVHFGLNTFAGVSWGDGTFPAEQFAPSALDTDQWAGVARAAGMRYAILTTKHHDGFCLWPTRLTDYSVARSPGSPDVVARFIESCHAADIVPGLYYSLWDRHCPFYDDDARYADYMFAQIEELLTQYGPIVNLWFDGGWDKDHPTRNWHWDPKWRETQDRSVLNGSRWRWPELYKHIHALQPDCLVLNNSSSDRPGVVKSWPADLRSSEHFDFVHAGRLCEPLVDPVHTGPDNKPYFLPLEYTTSLNPDWFYIPGKSYAHPSPETVASWLNRARADDANLLLNVGPDTRGLIPSVHSSVLNRARSIPVR